MTKREAHLLVDETLRSLRQGIIPEDTTLELKERLMTGPRIARRLAGHANAARGQKVHWIFGVSERGIVTGVDDMDFLAWRQDIDSHFAGKPPELEEYYLIIEEKSVLLVTVTTDAAPYVWKNPDFGINKTVIQYEVPIRKNTGIQSADQLDLYRMLSFQSKSIKTEVLDAYAYVQRLNDHKYHVYSYLDLYLESEYTPNNPKVIPFHRSKCAVVFAPDNYALELSTIGVENIDSKTILKSTHEALLIGPGRLRFQAFAETGSEVMDWITIQILESYWEFPTIGLENPLQENVSLAKGSWSNFTPLANRDFAWRMQK